MIPLHKASIGALELAHVQQVMTSGQLAGNGRYTRHAESLLENTTGAPRVLLTSSCTHALEMAALLLGVQPGDEVICPSFTFMSTANAFVLRGARIVFVDIDPGSMCIDVAAVRAAITPRTVGIVPVHYAGACCDMDALMALAGAHRLWVVEDAAQAVRSTWRGRPLGSIGDLGAFSFHAGKVLTAGGEGGALLVNDAARIARAEILREKGTDRDRWLRGEVGRYQWQDLGSSWLVSELQAAFLCAQLERADELVDARRQLWQLYHAQLLPLEQAGLLRRPVVCDDVNHNGSGYFVHVDAAAGRDAVSARCCARGVEAVAHYTPLHASPAGRRFGDFQAEDFGTTRAAATLLRLPLWPGMAGDDVAFVVSVLASALAA